MLTQRHAQCLLARSPKGGLLAGPPSANASMQMVHRCGGCASSAQCALVVASCICGERVYSSFRFDLWPLNTPSASQLASPCLVGFKLLLLGLHVAQYPPCQLLQVRRERHALQHTRGKQSDLIHSDCARRAVGVPKGIAHPRPKVFAAPRAPPGAWVAVHHV